jgi:hypothetical protein
MRLFAAVDIIRLLCQCLPGAMPVVMEPSSQELATLERCGSPEMAGCFSARVRGRLFAIQRESTWLSRRDAAYLDADHRPHLDLKGP